jgi:hypothetical protein
MMGFPSQLIWSRDGRKTLYQIDEMHEALDTDPVDRDCFYYYYPLGLVRASTFCVESSWGIV